MKNFFVYLIIMTLYQINPVQAQNQEDTILFSAVGDLMLGTTYPENRLNSDPTLLMFGGADKFLSESDVAMGNLEGTLYDGEPQPDGKRAGPNRFLFKTPTTWAQLFKDAGFTFLSLANNHIIDFGQAGIDSTKRTLREINLPFASKAGEIATYDIRGAKIAIIAVDYYKGRRSILNLSSLFNEIIKLKKQNYLVVVSAHAGGEGANYAKIPEGEETYLGENRGNSIMFARGAVDAGADAIVIQGPHVPRAIEIYKKRVIFYSLGNFLTGKGIDIGGLAGLAPLVQFKMRKNGEFDSGSVVSFVQRRNPVRVEMDRKSLALKLIQELSFGQFPETAPVFDGQEFKSQESALELGKN